MAKTKKMAFGGLSNQAARQNFRQDRKDLRAAGGPGDTAAQQAMSSYTQQYKQDQGQGRGNARPPQQPMPSRGGAPSAPMNANGGQYQMPSWQEARSNFRDARAAGNPNMPSMHDFRQQYNQQQQQMNQQQQRGLNQMPQSGMQTQLPGGGLPNANPGGMAPMGPGTQTGGPAPMGFGPKQNAPTGKTFDFGSIGMSGPSSSQQATGYKKGGAVKAAKMGAVKVAKPKAGSASSRGDGIAQRGKTRGSLR